MEQVCHLCMDHFVCHRGFHSGCQWVWPRKRLCCNGAAPAWLHTWLQPLLQIMKCHGWLWLLFSCYHGVRSRNLKITVLKRANKRSRNSNLENQSHEMELHPFQCVIICPWDAHFPILHTHTVRCLFFLPSFTKHWRHSLLSRLSVVWSSEQQNLHSYFALWCNQLLRA